MTLGLSCFVLITEDVLGSVQGRGQADPGSTCKRHVGAKGGNRSSTRLQWGRRPAPGEGESQGVGAGRGGALAAASACSVAQGSMESCCLEEPQVPRAQSCLRPLLSSVTLGVSSRGGAQKGEAMGHAAAAIIVAGLGAQPALPAPPTAR